MGRNITRILLFFSVFAIIFAGLNHLMVPKNNSSEAGMYDAFAKGFLAEPENSLDVLFLGDSEIYCCIVPLLIWEAQGITSYTCGTSDQALYQTEAFLYRATERQKPKIVFLETNIFYRDHSTLDVLPHWAEEVFPLFRYHDRWKKIRLNDFIEPIDFSHIVRDKGYLYKTDIDIPYPAQYEKNLSAQ